MTREKHGVYEQPSSGRRSSRRHHHRRYRAQQKGCPTTGKVRYPDQRAARDALRRVSHSRTVAEREIDADGHCELRSYSCDACGGWHLTSMSRQEYAKRQQHL